MEFWATHQQTVPEEDKLAWITQEIGKDTSLREFGCKFVELFGDKIRDVCTQKKGVLKLYQKYAEEGAAWHKQCDLPPENEVEFDRIWNADAPLKCLECGKVSGTQPYCSTECENAGYKIKCMLCKDECSCARPLLRPREDAAPLEKMLSKMLITGEQWTTSLFRTREADATHEPAWKKRKRSS